MKKSLLVALFLVVCLSFSACTETKGNDNNKTEYDSKTEITAVKEYKTVDLTDYKNYYFDGRNGNDANDGLSESKAFKSIKKAEEIAMTATGDNPVRLLFKKGTEFIGNGVFKGFNSTETKPLILDSYGQGDTYPCFTGSGSEGNICAVLEFQDDNIRIFNLEVTGPTAYQGIYFQPKSGGAYKNIVIDGCYVHDINFNWKYQTAPKDTSPDDIDVEEVCTQYTQRGDKYGRYVYRKYAGISLDSDLVTAPLWYENVWVTNNKVENIGKIGINIYNHWDNQPGVDYGYNRYAGDDIKNNDESIRLGRFPHKNIYFAYNEMTCCGGDAMVLSGTQDSVIEGNVSYYANYLGRAGYWNAGIWCFSSRNVYFQFNEAAYTYKRHGSGDSEGFDIDNSCSNVYLRYNYAHHNEGGGLLLCNRKTTISVYASGMHDGKRVAEKVSTLQDEWGKWENNLVYCNVFAYNGNELTPSCPAFLAIARNVSNSYFYNNTVVMGGIEGQSIINTEDQVACGKLHFYNNIFYSSAKNNAKFTMSLMTDSEFDNNVFCNVTEQGLKNNSDIVNKNAKTVALKLNLPTNINGYQSVKFFEFDNAELYGNGYDLSQNKALHHFTKDILKQSVTDYKYMGAIAE